MSEREGASFFLSEIGKKESVWLTGKILHLRRLQRVRTRGEMQKEREGPDSADQ